MKQYETKSIKETPKQNSKQSIGIQTERAFTTEQSEIDTSNKTTNENLPPPPDLGSTEHSSDSDSDHISPKSKFHIHQIKTAFENLSVPQTHRKRYTKKIKKLQDNRKKKFERDYTTDDGTDIEEEIFIPDKPLTLPASTKFILPGKIGDVDVIFEVDSGSATSIINKTVFDQLDPSIILSQRQPTKHFVNYSGQKIDFFTEVTIQVKFDNSFLQHNFLVTKSEKSHNLIGVDLIRSKRLSIEVDDDCRAFICFKRSDNSKKKRIALLEHTDMNLYVAETTIINPGTTFVNVSFSEDYINLVNADQLHNSVGLTKSSLEPFPSEDFLSSIDADGNTIVPIQNRDFGSTVVFKGQLIGTFKPLTKGTEIYNKELNISEVIGDNSKVEPNIENAVKYLEHHFKDKIEETKTARKSNPQATESNMVNKIKLTNKESDCESSAVGESDLADELFTKIRIPESSKVWEDLLKDVPEHLRKRTFHMLTEKYPNVVSRHSTDFGCCNLENSEFPINLTDDIPVTSKPYPLNSVYEQQLKEIIDEMVKNDLLIPESSSYCSGVFIRSRPDQTNTMNHRVRVISDYRALNAKTIEDHFPIPNLKMILQKLNKKKFFIMVDLKDSYQSIKIRESDRYKASLVTSFGQFSPARLGFGYRNAPSFFSRQIYRILHDLDGCFNFLDDICVFGETAEECLDNFEKVVERLERFGFRINLSKLQMFKSYLKVLGVVISQHGITCDDAKVKSVMNYPPPKTKLEMQRFLGLVNYLSDFIPDYSLISAPLYKLASGTEDKFTMSDENMTAFEKLKEVVAKPTLLSFIDKDLPIYVECDASATAYGGLAYQVHTYDENDLPELKRQHEELMNKTREELDDELRSIINKYTSGEEVPEYNVNSRPNASTETSEEFFTPYLNSPLKIKKRKGKVYIPRVNFYFSKKFSDVQQRSWSSLMKELSALLDVCEKRSDFLALAKETILLSDCSACIYLYQQSKSNSLLSRYLSRLNNYNFKIMVKHKSGKALRAADALSRMYVLNEEDPTTPDRIDHRQGILVKVPFEVGTLVTPADIISYLQSGEEQICIPTSDESISKCCQTDENQSQVNSVVENKNHPTNLKGKILQELSEILTHENYAKKQQTEFKELYEKLLVKPLEDKKIENGLIVTKYKDRYVRLTPPSLRNALLSRFHLLGHYSHVKLLKLITKTDVWPGIRLDCKDFTSKCISCIFIRPGRKDTYKLGYPLTGKTGEVWMLDVVSGMPSSKGHSFFLSAIDTFSRYTITFPLRTDTSQEIVKKLEERVFGVFGSPAVVITDGAQNLGKSNKFIELCQIYKTQVKIRSPYSSRSLGLCERVHRSILDNLRSLTDSFRNSWVDNLPLATALQNTVPHRATNLTPFEIMFGRENKLWNPLKDINEYQTSNPDLTKYHESLQNRLNNLFELAKRQDESYKKQMREHYGGKTYHYKPGSFVLSQNKLPAVNEKLKVRPKYYGPFMVMENLETTVIAENVMNGRISYLNKNLIKPIAEKSIEKYSDLPHHVKQVFGEGFTNEMWQNLHKADGLVDVVQRRNQSHTEFGLEHPLEKLVSYKEVVETQDEILKMPTRDDTTSSEDDQASNQPPEQVDPKPADAKRVTFADENDNSQVLPRRSSRTIKHPDRLDL